MRALPFQEVFGTRQSGIPNVKFASITNQEQIKKGKMLAEELYKRGYKLPKLFTFDFE